MCGETPSFINYSSYDFFLINSLRLADRYPFSSPPPILFFLSSISPVRSLFSNPLGKTLVPDPVDWPWNSSVLKSSSSPPAPACWEDQLGRPGEVDREWQRGGWAFRGRLGIIPCSSGNNCDTWKGYSAEQISPSPCHTRCYTQRSHHYMNWNYFQVSSDSETVKWLSQGLTNKAPVKAYLGCNLHLEIEAKEWLWGLPMVYLLQFSQRKDPWDQRTKDLANKNC